MNPKVKEIEEYLEELFPNAYCELNYQKDYELLLAVMLSAQTTDKRVNKVTPILFSKYDTLEKLKDAPLQDLERIIREIGTYHKKAIFLKTCARTGLFSRRRPIYTTRTGLIAQPKCSCTRFLGG